MNLDTINKSLREKEDWDIPCLTIDLYDVPAELQSSSALPKQHDLTNFFPNELTAYYHQGGGIDKDERLWFPSKFSDAPSICREINNQSCFKGGYELVCDTTSKSKKFTKTTLRCQCHARPKKSRGEGKKKTQSTKPQVDNATCGMYLNIFKDNTTGQYYIRKNGGHNLHHSGHPPIQKEPSGEKRRRIGTLSKHDGNKKRHTSSLAMITERKNQSAYTRCLSLYEEAAQACNSEEDIQELVDVLNNFRSKKITKNCTNTAPQPLGQIMSLPEQETKKNVPRKKPMLSPSKLR